MTAIGLGDEQGQVTVGQHLCVSADFGLDVRGVVVRVEVARRDDSGDVSGGALDVALPRTGDEGHGDAVAQRLVAQGGQVTGAVLAVEEVELVLQLHHDDGAVGRVLALGEQRQHLVEPSGDLGEEARLVLPYPQVGIEPQPGRQRAAVPLGTDVGPGAGNDVQPGLLREVQEGGDIAPALEGPAARRQLVEVPRKVDVDAGVSRVPDLFEPGAPLLPRQAEVEQGRAQHDTLGALDPDAPDVQLDAAAEGCWTTHLTPALPPLMSISYRYRWPR